METCPALGGGLACSGFGTEGVCCWEELHWRRPGQDVCRQEVESAGQLPPGEPWESAWAAAQVSHTVRTWPASVVRLWLLADWLSVPRTAPVSGVGHPGVSVLLTTSERKRDAPTDSCQQKEPPWTATRYQHSGSSVSCVHTQGVPGTARPLCAEVPALPGPCAGGRSRGTPHTGSRQEGFVLQASPAKGWFFSPHRKM